MATPKIAIEVIRPAVQLGALRIGDRNILGLEAIPDLLDEGEPLFAAQPLDVDA
jgi:hypothetical protein